MTEEQCERKQEQKPQKKIEIGFDTNRIFFLLGTFSLEEKEGREHIVNMGI